MKKLFSFLAMALIAVSALGQTPRNVKYVYTQASDLDIIGKISKTENPYHRVDTVKYKGFTKYENAQVRCSSGLAVLFKTNSTTISVKTVYGFLYTGTTTNWVAHRGYDLYIKKDGKWIFAAAGVAPMGKESQNKVIIKNMDGSEKECMLYLPLYSEEKSILIGIQKGASIEPIESPFRHRVGIFGSSYTHGVCCGRAGMTYPAQFTRNTGIQLLSLGCSGNCKLQPYFANVLADADVDALVFDTFSNPSPQQMRERLFPFIEKIQAAHPDIPLIFQRTIYREQRNFDKECDAYEKAKMQTADSLMDIACRKYKNVYYIRPNASAPDHETSIDGIHPSNYGYQLWAESIRKPILKILKKYGMK
ncbi:MAG: SGNH/GDSL hydrolase family protein [Bacteroidales bacterium]|jgi:hypothetical protein|nr:SGNH/GDSL hydrolase family protein [Bacteroidales bacterium]MCI1784642.1 SGNH/GDSL hydrolase family protein [Bacteroidales bacterium]